MLAQPESTDHQCQDDQFIVSGGSPIPAICGTNSGAHSKMRYKLLLKCTFLPLFQFLICDELLTCFFVKTKF